MNRGYLKLWRKSKESAVFAHEGLWKLWCLCLMKATHQEIEITISGLLKPVKLTPGQFITGRYSLHEDYHQAHLGERYRRKLTPTPYSLWRWLLTLEGMQILSIKSYNKYSIITITNWGLYQENEHQVSIRRASGEHKQEQGKHSKEETRMLFSSLRARYPNQDLLDRAFSAIASTRKSNKVSDSVLITQLEKWKRYPVEQVEAAMRTYLDRDYAGQGKREEYLLGIIRNQQSEEVKPESTGSPALDAYYAGQDQ